MRLGLKVMNSVAGTDRHDRIHVRGPRLRELGGALREEAIKTAGHGLNEHVQRFAAGIAKGMNAAPGHEHRRFGRNSDPVALLQKLGWSRGRPEPFVLMVVAMRRGAAPGRGDVGPHAEFSAGVVSPQMKNHLIPESPYDAGVVRLPDLNMGFGHKILGKVRVRAPIKRNGIEERIPGGNVQDFIILFKAFGG